jgi:hypothetical protein
MFFETTIAFHAIYVTIFLIEVPMNWVVFSYSLPTKSVSSPRVTLWRRLRRLGAISPAGGVQVLPARDECIEAFQWLAQEIRQAQGDALLMRVEQFEGLTDQQLIDLFHAARKEEYTELEAQAAELEKALGRRVKSTAQSDWRDALDKLRRRYAEINRVDYFDCPTGKQLAARLTRIEQLLSPQPTVAAHVNSVAIDDYRGKSWVTRPHPHVDRLACAWLIRRFVDPAAVIRYSSRPRSDEIAFDMEEGQFGHQGNLCTFETICRAFDLDDAGLRALAEIVHEIDLRDGRYIRPEIAGIEAVLDGWLLTGCSDTELESQGRTLFEGLYTALARKPVAEPQKKRGDRVRRGRYSE